ncbi:hypothetical protein PYCCODRAFT_1480999 [Trametes coccinea BRFM310]|uniref:Fungal-type protein kinase domain-containing protein n=1 Tax=Trametes coccinea (strain BRFM310) TaxID=1353009 RepID=A0A1Y2I9P0_TRAC3|nr:hypothetical protein PYCCODRAFT_1480999 [Trametes coccinea BRFM310]
MSSHCKSDHARIVNIGVGHPLTEFASSRDMVAAVRDAIEVHRIVWESAKVLPQNVGLDSILIADNPPEGPQQVFLHDFDYSNTAQPVGSDSQCHVIDSMQDDVEVWPDEVERSKARQIGAYPFIAIELLDPAPDTRHGPSHNVESFFWVLMWVVLRHTYCYRQRWQAPDDLFKRLFGANVDHSACACKAAWLLNKRELTVYGNEPLTTLVRRLAWLVGVSQEFAYVSVPWQELTHSAVLAIFDEALAMDGWLENDWKPWVLLQGTDTTPRPIVHETVPGYTNCDKGRTLPNKPAAITSLNPGFPDPPLDYAFNDTLAPAQRSGRKRANERNDPDARAAKRPRKRIKTGTIAPPLAPVSRDIHDPGPPPAPQFEAAIAGSSKAATSGRRRRRNGPKAALTPARQPTRRSARIQAQKERLKT